MRASLTAFDVGIGLLTPHLDLGLQHSLNTFQPGQVLAFQGQTQNFTVLGAPLASDAVALRTGVDLAIMPDTLLSIDYDGSFSNQVQNNAIRGQLSLKF